MLDTTDLEPLLIDIEKVVELTGFGKTTIYALIKAGELRPAKFGSKTVFSYAEVRAFAGRLLASRDNQDSEANKRSAEAKRRRAHRQPNPQQQTQW